MKYCENNIRQINQFLFFQEFQWIILNKVNKW
jgi:hypothetical protein